MNPVDLPIEVQIGFLMEMNPDELLDYCLTSKEAYRICTSHEFLHQYVFRKYNLDLNRLPGKTPWNAFSYLNRLIEKSNHDFSIDTPYYYPWEEPERPQFELSEELDKLICSVVALDYPELVEVIIQNIIDHSYASHDYGDLRLNEAFGDALAIGDPALINVLLRYYKNPEMIEDLTDHPEMILESVQKYPELAWILLAEEIPMPKETEKYLRSVLPQTGRYNRVHPIPFLKAIVSAAEKYDSRTPHNLAIAKEYNEKISKIKKLIRPDLAAEF